MGDSSDAAARAAVSAKAVCALPARATAALGGSGSISGQLLIIAALASVDLAKWSGKVEAGFLRVNTSFDDK